MLDVGRVISTIGHVVRIDRNKCFKVGHVRMDGGYIVLKSDMMI